MAWRALKNWFLHFRKKPYVNQVHQYRVLLWNQWFDSLTPKQQETYKQNKAREREKIIQDANRLLTWTRALSSNMPDFTVRF